MAPHKGNTDNIANTDIFFILFLPLRYFCFPTYLELYQKNTVKYLGTKGKIKTAKTAIFILVIYTYYILTSSQVGPLTLDEQLVVTRHLLKKPPPLQDCLQVCVVVVLQI